MIKPRLKLSTIIIIFVCLVVLISLIITDLLFTDSTSENIRDYLEEKAFIVSRTVAESQIVKNGLLDKDEHNNIQDYTSTIQEETDVLFVVVMDMSGIRQSHPNPERIGNHFVGGDEVRALQGEEYISSSTGTLGESLRAFTPIYDDNQNQIGAVSVGISLDAVQQSIQQSHKRVIIGSIFGLLVGIIGAFLLAKYIKKSLFGLEPHAIARIHEERNQMLHSVREGIIAIDRNATIVLVNKSARQVFRKAGLMVRDPIGMKINDFLPGTMLGHVLNRGDTDLDEEQTINGVSIITNRVPLVVNDQVVGAIATFRDKTEVNQLAEQLTGVQLYADTLRAQSHEFMNQLHVLLGLIKMENYEEVNQFISRLVNHQAHEVGNVTRHIKDPAFAGFIIGKMSAARESHVSLTINCETEIPQPDKSEVTHELITILGNIIDNAIESVSNSEQKRIKVNLAYVDELLSITVSDTGAGIPDNIQEEIFAKGMSTKAGNHRGFGLYLTQRSVEKLAGSVDFSSNHEGTLFTLIIPYQPGGERND
ncbi:two-component system sensor histidine kinase DcuS [Virgibacillus phasianinus]|uniref:histidine kinase n=1 Tax=Virgibacillus phasianinus TaxID=2017483 RepID=A0A220U353_9BACI|nr:DcuS/MalK family sensor histidine kinase [Virgibacillus phasianinus]ASK62530.1 two-component system sensor histidine kinase DcuS [Virgibacillus phasianinus]